MLTTREKRACFRHAKEHAVEAINDALVDEHHSIMEVDGVTRRDMQGQTEKYLERFLRQIKRAKFEDE